MIPLGNKWKANSVGLTTNTSMAPASTAPTVKGQTHSYGAFIRHWAEKLEGMRQATISDRRSGASATSFNVGKVVEARTTRQDKLTGQNISQLVVIDIVDGNPAEAVYSLTVVRPRWLIPLLASISKGMNPKVVEMHKDSTLGTNFWKMRLTKSDLYEALGVCERDKSLLIRALEGDEALMRYIKTEENGLIAASAIRCIGLSGGREGEVACVSAIVYLSRLNLGGIESWGEGPDLEVAREFQRLPMSPMPTYLRLIDVDYDMEDCLELRDPNSLGAERLAVTVEESKKTYIVSNGERIWMKKNGLWWGKSETIDSHIPWTEYMVIVSDLSVRCCVCPCGFRPECCPTNIQNPGTVLDSDEQGQFGAIKVRKGMASIDFKKRLRTVQKLFSGLPQWSRIYRSMEDIPKIPGGDYPIEISSDSETGWEGGYIDDERYDGVIDDRAEIPEVDEPFNWADEGDWGNQES
jgi:hypothetical protein